MANEFQQLKGQYRHPSAARPMPSLCHTCNRGYRNGGWMRMDTIRFSTVLRLPSDTAFHSGHKPRKEI